MKDNKLLSENLEKSWKRYERSVHASRENLSPQNIHQVRVATQRLEAALSLAHSLKEMKKADHITNLLKKVRKGLGPLRDSQVGSNQLENIHGGKKLAESFKQDQHHAQKKARTALKNIELKHDKLNLIKITKNVCEIESKEKRKDLQKQLDHKMKSSILKFNLLLGKINPEQMKEIHHFRIFAKKLRYQAECIQSFNKKLQFSLKELKNVQSVAGKIQNDTVLLNKLNQFLSESKRKDSPRIEKICKSIELHREKLIKKDFSQLNSLEWAK